MFCTVCDKKIDWEEWEIIKVDRFGEIVPICDFCFELECLWWDDYFQKYPEEFEDEIILGIV